MTQDRDDTLLDACLDEVLGGRTPPDLSARIMQAWQVRRAEPAQNGNGYTGGSPLLPPSAVPVSADWEPAAPPIVAPPVPADIRSPNCPIPVAPSATKTARPIKVRSRRHNWLALAVAIGTVAIGLSAALVAVRYLGQGGKDVVNVKQPDPKPGPDKKTPVVKETQGQLADKHNQKTRPGTIKPGSGKTVSGQGVSPPDTDFVTPAPFGPREPKSQDSDPSFTRPKAPPVPDAEIIAFMNEALKQSWAEKGVKPVALATDAEWCRRTYLRVIGRIPTVEELKSFAASKSPDKRSELVERLVSAETYREEFARHWSEFFANVLIGRGAAAEEGGVSREGLLAYLRQAIVSGKPYDRLAYDLLTATGTGQPGSSDYNGAANFLLASLNDKAVLATSRTSRVFLGKQLQCAQCHNHPSNDWSQNQFWELNAFFRQMRAERDRTSGVVRLLNRDFAGEGGDPAEADVYYEVPSGRMKVAYPQFPNSPSISRSGLVDEVDRRTELAKRVVASDDLARAAVNRLWAHFLGFGFTRPVDDMGPHNPPSHPELLERVSGQFAAHEYHLPSLIRWIVLSDAFGVSSKIGPDNLVDAPEAGERPLFSRYYTRQMQPEQVFESLQIAAAAPKNSSGGSELEKARISWLSQFTRQMGTDDGEEQNTFNGDIRQSIIMMSGPLTERAISRDRGSLVDRVSQSKLPFDEKVEHLFMAAVARKPTKREVEAAAEIHTKRADDASALQDIWWALLNSNEFILDH